MSGRPDAIRGDGPGTRHMSDWLDPIRPPGRFPRQMSDWFDTSRKPPGYGPTVPTSVGRATVAAGSPRSAADADTADPWPGATVRVASSDIWPGGRATRRPGTGAGGSAARPDPSQLRTAPAHPARHDRHATPGRGTTGTPRRGAARPHRQGRPCAVNDARRTANGRRPTRAAPARHRHRYHSAPIPSRLESLTGNDPNPLRLAPDPRPMLRASQPSRS